MKKITLVFSFFLVLRAWAVDEISLNRFDQVDLEKQKDAALIREYPELKKFLFTPPRSNLYIGFGGSPIGLVGSKFMITASFFQLHYMDSFWDIELFNASFSKISAKNEFAEAKSFSVKMAPKINLFKIFETGTLSIGAMIGIEATEFENILVQQKKNVRGRILKTSNLINLTTVGAIYGAVLSQSFKLKSGNIFRLSEYYYYQNHKIKNTKYDWENDPRTSEGEESAAFEPANLEELEPKSVIMVEFSYLF